MTDKDKRIAEFEAEILRINYEREAAAALGDDFISKLKQERDQLRKLCREMRHALDRLSYGVKWQDNPEWFDEVKQKADAILGDV